jgi:H+/Cl- antiporter ClcA
MRLGAPALVVGVASSLILLGANWLAQRLHTILWTAAPAWLGMAPASSVWIVLVLVLTGAAVGVVIWKAPGHAGPDPATTGLVEPPLPLLTMPGLLLALVLGLAGGISLGPENPIMALNTGIVFAFGRLLLPAMAAEMWVGIATAGMIGAMFGTPVAAALILTEASAGPADRPLWDRLFGPLIAAGAGAIVTDVLVGASFKVTVAPYGGPHLVDIFLGGAVGAVAALLGLVAALAFRWVHPLLNQLGNPVLRLTLGGVLLGILGVIGGPLTLFKGLDEMQQLAATAAQYSAAALAGMALIKMAALVIASTSGFRGGRIFPSVFAGVALGLAANALVPAIPQGLAVASAVLGLTMAVTRQGWLSLFLAATVVPEQSMVPVLCLVSLPAWLVVTGRPEMVIRSHEPPPAEPADGARPGASAYPVSARDANVN